MYRALAFLAVSFAVLSSGDAPAFGQTAGGTLRISHRDNPPSASIHEESTISVNQPFMGVFNNLVFFDPKEKVNSPDHIVPELAESWSYNPDQTQLTFKLRQGVKWHDGKPFTSADVKCTWDMLRGISTEKLRVNPRKSWYDNLEEVVATDPYQAVFVLKRRQPSILAILATGMSPVYPCHVSPAAMRASSCGCCARIVANHCAAYMAPSV